MAFPFGTAMSAVAEISPAALPAPTGSTWSNNLRQMNRGQQARLALGLVLIALVLAGAYFWRTQIDYKVLFANLGDKDGGAIIAQLSQMNVPYRHAEGGNAILVPADRVNDLRMRLASQGLPKGSAGGFDSLEANRLGMTQFQERLTFQRGLEGELTRSIQSLASVQAARVHLAIPNQNGFFREQQKASASVLLSLHPGRSLDRAQIAGIVHLVASSVPEMSPEAVSVVDDTGKLLSQAPDAANGGADVQQLAYIQQLEQSYTRRILDILEPVVGRGNVKAQVSTDVDFSQTESTSESHRPNQGNEPAAVRSMQLTETGPNGSGNSQHGVPGAVSNQPPSTTSTSLTGATPTLSAGVGNTGGSSALGMPGAKKEMVTNYEVDKTVRVVRGGSAVVKRVNAAVVINHISAEEKGKTVTKPLPPQQLEQLTALVRETVGFNKERGDSVNVVNAAFNQPKVEKLDVPVWKRPEVVDSAKSFAWPVASVVITLLVLQLLIKPVFAGGKKTKGVLAQAGEAAAGGPVSAAGAAALGDGAAGTQLQAIEGEVLQRPELLGSDGTLAAGAAPLAQLTLSPAEQRLEDARNLTRNNPVAVANIVKGWMVGDANPA